MCACVSFLGLVFCLLMTTVCETSCPLSLYSCPSLPFLPLSPLILCLSLLFLPPFPFTPPLPPNHRFKQLASSSADTSSMQIESPLTLRLSHFLAVFLFSLPFRDYVVMRVSCLYSKTFLTSLSFALTFAFSLSPLHSHVVTLSCYPLPLSTPCYIN